MFREPLIQEVLGKHHCVVLRRLEQGERMDCEVKDIRNSELYQWSCRRPPPFWRIHYYHYKQQRALGQDLHFLACPTCRFPLTGPLLWFPSAFFSLMWQGHKNLILRAKPRAWLSRLKNCEVDASWLVHWARESCGRTGSSSHTSSGTCGFREVTILKDIHRFS